jgi:hypothetical protein
MKPLYTDTGSKSKMDLYKKGLEFKLLWNVTKKLPEVKFEVGVDRKIYLFKLLFWWLLFEQKTCKPKYM